MRAIAASQINDGDLSFDNKLILTVLYGWMSVYLHNSRSFGTSGTVRFPDDRVVIFQS